MPALTFWEQPGRKRAVVRRPHRRRSLLSLLGAGLWLLVLLLALAWPASPAYGRSTTHTNPTVDVGCTHLTFTADGNPFGLCPGPYPQGGNCVWWAWEQWHWLNYNLPPNWGNAAEWAVDAERAGLAVGTRPRVGAIAVFPVADGVWAFGAAGHVAFVTWVSPDGSTFNVTYQNYGDPTPWYVGIGYNVDVINQPRYQRGQLRFIYFPGLINEQLFARLPGVDGNSAAQVQSANQALLHDPATPAPTSARLALGLPPTSSEEEFNADFSGNGYSDLLLYNRQRGTLQVLHLLNTLEASKRPGGRLWPYPEDPVAGSAAMAGVQLVTLADAQTPANGWGSDLDIRVGSFDGSGQAQILLYNRLSGQIQLLKLGPDLHIQQHVTLSGWGGGWEVYVGRFNGKSTSLLLYNRFANAPAAAVPSPIVTATATPSPTASSAPTTRPQPTVTPTVTASPTPTATPSPTPTVTASPTPTPTATPSPTPTVTASPTPTPTVTASPTPTPTVTASPTPTATPSPTATATPTVTASPTASPTPTATATPTVDTAASGKAMPLSDVRTTAPTLDMKLGFNSDDGGGLSLDGGSAQTGDLTPNLLLLDFTGKLTVQHFQRYTLSQNDWEIYIGRFVSADQDGLFLYDRLNGVARLISFDAGLHVVQNQGLADLGGNWQVYSGDFSGAGRAQVLLYDPTTGDVQLLAFDARLHLSERQSYAPWQPNQLLYVGHFGSGALGVMLYDPLRAESTFIAFDKGLQISHQYTVASWDQQWQILIGSFVDRSRCIKEASCASGDDILVLNRKTGRLEQYAFTFNASFKVFDNRGEAFVREGLAQEDYLSVIDTSTFSLLSTLDTSIRGEELY